jgi:hypothetical protein
MILSLIKEQIAPYKAHIQTRQYDQLDKWQLLKTFQDHWDIAAVDLGEMYARSFPDDLENPFLQRDFAYPKKVMAAFIEMDSDVVRQLFQILFTEEGGMEVEMRIQLFADQCDEMLKALPRTGNIFFNDHFHDQREILSLYLALRHPALYAPFQYGPFAAFMQAVKAKSIPGPNQTGRFFTVCRSIAKVLQQVDPELLAIHRGLLSEEHYRGECLWLVQDLMQFAYRK